LLLSSTTYIYRPLGAADYHAPNNSIVNIWCQGTPLRYIGREPVFYLFVQYPMLMWKLQPRNTPNRRYSLTHARYIWQKCKKYGIWTVKYADPPSTDAWSNENEE